MVQRGEQVRFAVEAREPGDVSREGAGQDFQRDIAIQLRVTRPIDLAHAPFAKHGHDFVRAKASARSEGTILSLHHIDAPRGRAVSRQP